MSNIQPSIRTHVTIAIHRLFAIISSAQIISSMIPKAISSLVLPCRLRPRVSIIVKRISLPDSRVRVGDVNLARAGGYA